MPHVEANGINIEYEISGDGPPLLLVMGLGGQLTDWPSAFVELLSEHFTVIRYDNRDSGLSTWSDAPVPPRSAFLKAFVTTKGIDAPYRLSDLAADGAGLLNALGIDSAHVVGMSMGGMIAQLMALDHPGRVRSLCSVMSNTGSRSAGRPTAKVMAALARRQEPDRAAAVDATVAFFEMIGGPDWDPIEHRERSSASIERAYNPAGIIRQSLAIAVTPDRTERLGTVAAPTLVVHGLDDPLVRPSGGTATAAAIPGSRLLMFPGMGHDLPATRHREIVEAIVRNSKRVGTLASA